jgi:hypothetical protein
LRDALGGFPFQAAVQSHHGWLYCAGGLPSAQAGEVVEVTSHRKPIARLTGIKHPDSTPTSPLQAAIDAGIVTWNGQQPMLPPPVKLRGEGTLVSEIVLEDRG